MDGIDTIGGARVSLIERQRAEARVWFESLRNKICAALRHVSS